jgi:hypothetical protein
MRERTMIRVTLDRYLQEKLHNLMQPLEICDDEGLIVARVLPTVDSTRFEGLESPITKEELERRRANKGKTYSTAEVLARLGKL